METTYATDCGPKCAKCEGTLWGYRSLGMYPDDGMLSTEFEGKCATCHATDRFEIRMDCHSGTVQDIRDHHCALAANRGARIARRIRPASLRSYCESICIAEGSR